ncbi:hypothetical protein HMSSN139_26750 [Paenibacillus sp. HMSSN-139]|nr:hypothetical protein HMSSN139_26750 [Paenibacillus sp. HMSSN-139]
MASIEKRGVNSWRLVVEAGYDAEGKRIKRYKTIRVEDQALLRTTKRLNDYLDEELIKFKIEVEAGEYISPEKMTFKAFVSEWEKKFVQKNLEHNTILNYMMQINKRIVPYFGALQMEKIKTLHIITYLEKLQDEGLGSATVVYNYRVLRSVFSKAMKWRVIKSNPMDGVSKPKEKATRKLNVYDEEESIQLFKALQNESVQFKILVSLALTTGMRRGELLGLEWKHVDLDAGVIDIVQSIPAYKDHVPVIKSPKTKDSYRKVALSPSMIDELRVYKKEWNKNKLKERRYMDL